MIAWIIETLVASTLMMLLVLMLRDPVRRAFGPAVAYALWVLPVARLFMPALPGDWRLTAFIEPMVSDAESVRFVTGAMDPGSLPVEVAAHALVEVKSDWIAGPAELAIVPPVAAPDGAPLMLLLVGVWLAGAIAFLAYHLIAHARFCRRVQRQARRIHAVAEGRVQVIETDATQGPLAFGVWRKYVAFPRDFAERYDPVERNLALAHELSHHQRGDLIANWVALAVLALHWFNPVAWRAFKAFRADQEMACDADVLAGRAATLRHAYGRAIVKSAHGGAVSAACHLHTINDLKGRLKMLTKHRKMTRGQMIGGSLSVTALALAGLFTTASGTAAAEQVRDQVVAHTGVDLASLTLPTVALPMAIQAAAEAPQAPAVPSAPTVPPLPPVPVDPPQPPVAPDLPEVVMDNGKKVYVYRFNDGHGAYTVRQDKELDAAELAELREEARRASENAAGIAREIERNVPRITEMSCGGGGAVTEQSRDADGKKRIVICVDRIERMAEVAAKQAAAAERTGHAALASARAGLKAAMIGLKHARKAIEAEMSLSEDQRAEAIAGIDQAIGELEAERADPDL